MATESLPKAQRELVRLALSQIEGDDIDGFASSVSMLSEASLIPGDGCFLHRALSLHRAKHAEMLLKAGASTKSRDFRSVTPLMKAATFDARLTSQLLAAGERACEVDAFKRTPLHHSCGSVVAPNEIPAMLIEANADVNALDSSARTPLHYAAAIYDAKKITLLLEKGSRKNLTAQGELGTPLQYMLSSGSKSVAADAKQREKCAQLLA